MFKKLSLAAAIMGAAALAFSAFAPAASAAPPSPDVVIAGRGVLDAQGNGLVAMRGNIDAAVSADRGILLVKDESTDAVVRVDDYGDVAHWGGFTVYFGFRGNATIIGKHVAVIVIGGEVNVHAAGRGWAFLKGEGHYFVNGHGPFPWDRDGGFASITLPDAAPTVASGG